MGRRGCPGDSLQRRGELLGERDVVLCVGSVALHIVVDDLDEDDGRGRRDRLDLRGLVDQVVDGRSVPAKL